MGAISISTHRLHFGMKYPGLLPQGWELIESPDDWAIGKSPDGQRYFLSLDRAYPMRINEGRKTFLNPQGRWVDTHNGIIDL